MKKIHIQMYNKTNKLKHLIASSSLIRVYALMVL